MKTCTRLLLTAVLAAAALAARPVADDRLIVHEWGTFTTIAGKEGVLLDWRPLVASNDLPEFVYNINGPPAQGLRNTANVKGTIYSLVRMETPVIYFYATKPTNVSVRVGLPEGKITEWYPRAGSVTNGIDWGTIAVLPASKEKLPGKHDSSHYYAARETVSAMLRVCSGNGNEFEKFLFYRGVGNFALPVTASLEGDKLHLNHLDGLGKIIVFENRGGKIGYQVENVAGKELTVARPVSGKLDQLLKDLQQLLVQQGLYEKEASAMIKTWRDSWFEAGLRVFYVLPRSKTDEVLPLTIEPKPTETTRVLVGRIEVVTPELESDVLKNPRAHGRFAEPVLKQLLARTNDPMERERLEKLLKLD